MLWNLLRSLLFRLDPEWAHALGAFFLRVRGFATQGNHRPLARMPGWKGEIAGIALDSPLGLAAGFDKHAHLVLGLRSLGFGFVEIGTVTPLPQPGNPRPRLFRVPEARALINRMGFNSEGAEAVAARLTHLRAFSRITFPIGVNLGKNRDTPLEMAGDDYVTGLDQLYSVADYLVVNLSSPNTPGLTGLQEGSHLGPLLRQVREARDRQARRAAGHPRALFLKLSPDLTAEARRTAVELAAAEGFGIIASNTSRRRDLPLVEKANAVIAAEAGGLSGAPLSTLSLEHLREIRSVAGPKMTVISVGGLTDASDARARLDAGANFLQVYTEFVYAGPGFPRRLALDLSRLPTSGSL
jgi:dihydroorotate dehydrogenase